MKVPLACLVLVLSIYLGPMLITGQEIVQNEHEADYAIVSTRVRILRVDDSEAGGNYELWGNFRVHHNDYTMARTNIGSPNDAIICAKSQVNGPRDWAGDIAIAGAGIAGAIATGGTSTAIIAAGVALTVVSEVMANVQVGPSNCDNGYIATASYPISRFTDTRPYNFVLDMREDDAGEDDVWQVDTKSINWSSLDECWGESFQPGSTPHNSCVYNVDTHFGRVSFESAILAWVKGPLVDGEVQDFNGDGHTIVTRSSFYGPSYHTHTLHG